jgi:oxygen-independent coproporphyrinogen-3 oxidase
MQELDLLLSLDLPHVSLYQLTIEEGTAFYKKGIVLPDDELARELYLMTVDKLKEKGLFLYEVSNFAKPSFECRHNLLYWHGDDYAGVGPAAHGRLGLIATENSADISQWLKNGSVLTQLTKEERFEEKIMMGLRLSQGMSAKDIDPKKIEKAVLNGWLNFNQENLWMSPTQEGLLMLNQLILMLIA